MSRDPEKPLLKGVSRSFYLSLRMLPKPMRGAASLAYLLARTSDTLADTHGIPNEIRLSCLDDFTSAMTGTSLPRWPHAVLNAIDDVREKQLLESTSGLFDRLHMLPQNEARLVQEVVGIITRGQKLDIQRFHHAEKDLIISLPDSTALDDYTWRVAGCVGAFWTKLGFLTLGNGFSNIPESVLLEKGITYGKGLQLVNILRDLPVDLANGRCYLPVPAPHDTNVLLDSHQQWLERAMEMTGAGFGYAENLESRRLRAASVLPAMIARETLELMRGISWEALRSRIKVPRLNVYSALLRALAFKKSTNTRGNHVN